MREFLEEILKLPLFSLLLFLTGAIRTRAVLDRESQPHYWLTVVAQDHGIASLSASIEVMMICISNDSAKKKKKVDTKIFQFKNNKRRGKECVPKQVSLFWHDWAFKWKHVGAFQSSFFF